MQSRSDREIETITKMIALYCRKQHGPENICKDCHELLEYALLKINKCPIKENKTTCAKCAIHCYSDEKRQAVKRIMRFSGPKMIYYHPILAVLHFVDSFR